MSAATPFSPDLPVIIVDITVSEGSSSSSSEPAAENINCMPFNARPGTGQIPPFTFQCNLSSQTGNWIFDPDISPPIQFRGSNACSNIPISTLNIKSNQLSITLSSLDSTPYYYKLYVYNKSTKERLTIDPKITSSA